MMTEAHLVIVDVPRDVPIETSNCPSLQLRWLLCANSGLKPVRLLGPERAWWSPALFCFDVGDPNHPRPLIRFLDDQLTKFSRRSA